MLVFIIYICVFDFILVVLIVILEFFIDRLEGKGNCVL